MWFRFKKMIVIKAIFTELNYLTFSEFEYLV